MKFKTFMTGSWEDLIISTYEVNKDLLEKYVPPNTELQLFKGKAYISMVAFTFSSVKFFGVKIPFHQQFGEINFRFYVKSKIDGVKGVVFLKEYAPKPIIALIANQIYSEPFFVKAIKREKKEFENKIHMKYSFPKGKVEIIVKNKTRDLKENTLEYFIVDRYKAFVKNKRKNTLQYNIKHIPWKLYETISIKIDDSALSLLPKEFKNAKLVSTYFADGSSISVEKGILQHQTNNNSVIT